MRRRSFVASLLARRNDALLNSIVGGSAISLSVRIAGLVLGFASHIVLSRSLGAAAYGLYAVAIGWVMIAVVPVMFGLDHSVLRFAARYIDQGHTDTLARLARFAAVFIATMALLCAGLIVTIASLWPDVLGVTSPTALAAMIALVAALAYLGVYGAFFRAARKIFFSQFFEQVLRAAVLIVALLAVLALGHAVSLDTALILTAASAWVAVLAMIVPLRRALSTRQLAPATPPPNIDAVAAAAPSVRSGRSLDWLSVSWPIFVATLAQQAQTQSTIILLAIFAADADAGRYAAAARFAALASFALVALNSVSAPMISAAYARDDRVELARIAKITARLSVFGAAGISVVLLAAGPWALRAFGPAFESAYPALVILLLAGVLGAAFGPAGNFLTMTRLQTASMIVTVVSLFLTVVAAACLIPLWGITGGAAAASIGILAQKALSQHVVWRDLGVDTSCIGLRTRSDGDSPTR